MSKPKSQLPAFSHQPKPYTGLSKSEVLKLRKKHLTPALITYHDNPVMIVEGNMQYVYDETGRRYLDGFGGIVTVSCGHSHPAILAAAHDQLDTLVHTTTIYANQEVALYGKELADRLPGDLSVCYFVNSGSEANDLALLMARLHTGNYDLIALRNAYHGGSQSTMGLTAHGTWKFSTPQGFGIHHALNPDPYRGPFANHEDPATDYAEDVRQLIEFATPGRIAGYIAESIQGVGGAIVFPDGYLKKAYEIARSHGGVCIADEVQAGFGRTGSHYWGFETQDVVPDIVVMAKGIGNGFPLAAVVTTPEIAASMTSHIHFNTYGGNPFISRVGRAVLETIDKDGLQKNSAEIGGYLLEKLEKLQEKHDLIGQVRGCGLMLGVELVTDRKAKTPATAECAAVWNRAKDLGLLIGKGGLAGNTLRIKPPMCITKDDADFMIDVLDEALAKV
ncbi:MAG: aminotransferase class III-fold pyridoxal phosphate-dependent enzyme [Verrucomicrobiales bacterium]|nr:aminotransferase class III-fold pyridoxal phosphate-dependent enzyme [Verrucomicrobiales bacterium]